MTHDYGRGVVGIDTVMHGRPGITAVYLLNGPNPALIETGPTTSLEHVLESLESAGADDLAWIVLTHIHLDHAGAVGHIARRFPRARIVVRVEGAPHLVDPTRLWASAARLYDDMERLWGSMVPVPEERIHAVSEDGAVADLGGGRSLRAVHTPGHARHHMSLIEPAGGDLFAGDALGVALPGVGRIRPATPPPDFDLEAALGSIERLRGLRAGRLLPTHFGPVPSVETALDEAAARLADWVAAAGQVIRDGGGLGETIEAFRTLPQVEGVGLDPAAIDRLEQTSSYELNALGILRYLSKRAQEAHPG